MYRGKQLYNIERTILMANILTEQTTLNRNPKVWLQDAWGLAKPYWVSEHKNKSILLLCLVIIFNLLVVFMSVMFNKWYNGFYNAIQHYDKTAFIHAIYKFAIMAFFYIAFQVFAYYFKSILEIKWRRWATKYYIDKWCKKKAYYKTMFVNEVSDNPDQRISADINSFIIMVLDLTLGMMNSIVSLCSFSVILWQISGPLKFSFHGYHFIIPGYMLFAAILYAIVGTYITFKIGRPLIKLNYEQQVYEANFRFGLMRVREHAENIAFYNGEEIEKNNLLQKFTNVVDNFVAIIYRQIKLDIFSVAYDQIANIFPIVVASPRYFAKVIQLGDLMQIAKAFGSVQDALSYFINSYTSLAGLRATMDRLYGFEKVITAADNLDSLPIKSGKNYLELKNLSINLPNGSRLVSNININLNSGDRLLIRGKSGQGKTTLLRTLAGLWSFAAGEIKQKSNLTSLFIAQRPYLPIASLADAITYPKNSINIDKSSLIQVLKDCGLDHLLDKLDLEDNWSNKLSLGEQQRVGFCRILLNSPDIVYLDEATSALDEESEELMYQLLIAKLPKSVIISVGHRSTIKKWHTQELQF